MTTAIEENVTTTAREQFEQLVCRHAYYLKQDDLQLTSEEEYAEILQSIQDHKYLTNERIPFEINLDQALFSWYENVYHPLSQMIDEAGLEWAFPGATRGQLFLWVARHWHFLKQEKGREITPQEAVDSYKAKFGIGLLDRFLHRSKKPAA